MEFLDWIENLHKSDPDSNGIVFIYHEQRKFIPYMILEAFKKYNLLSRFLQTVQSFANGYNFANKKCTNVKYLNLRDLSKVLLNQEEDKSRNYFEGNATVRARLAYEIAEHLYKQESSGDDPNMMKSMYDYAFPVSIEVNELSNQRTILEKQNSLRPIFLQYFKSTLYHRVRAVTFRRILAEGGLDYDSLKTCWNEEHRVSISEICINNNYNKVQLEREHQTLFVDPFGTPSSTRVEVSFRFFLLKYSL